MTITATDNAGYHGSTSFTWTVTNTVTVTNPGDQNSAAGTAITPLAVSASDSSSTATLSYSDGGTLPPGLSIDPSTGNISGTPTTAGSYPVTITATDNQGGSGTASFTWTITSSITVTNPGDQSDVRARPSPPSRSRHPTRRRDRPSPIRTAAPCRRGCPSTPRPGRSPGHRPPVAPTR